MSIEHNTSPSHISEDLQLLQLLRSQWINSPRSVASQMCGYDRLWWYGRTRTMVPTSVRAHRFWRKSLLGAGAAEVPNGNALSLLQHVHNAQEALFFMGRWSTTMGSNLQGHTAHIKMPKAVCVLHLRTQRPLGTYKEFSFTWYHLVSHGG